MLTPRRTQAWIMFAIRAVTEDASLRVPDALFKPL